MNGYGSVGVGELRDRRNAVRLIADIDEDVAAGDLQDPAFENLVAGGRRKVAVILEEMLILFRIHRRDRRFRLFHCSGRLVVCHWLSPRIPLGPRSEDTDRVRPRILSTIERQERACQTPDPIRQSAGWTCWRGEICLMISSTMAG